MGQLYISIYDKRDDFNFHITNFPVLSSNIYLRPLITFLSHILFDMPMNAPKIQDCFIEGSMIFQ